VDQGQCNVLNKYLPSATRLAVNCSNKETSSTMVMSSSRKSEDQRNQEKKQKHNERKEMKITQTGKEKRETGWRA
jgi:hypothetical protein